MQLLTAVVKNKSVLRWRGLVIHVQQTRFDFDFWSNYLRSVGLFNYVTDIRCQVAFAEGMMDIVGKVWLNEPFGGEVKAEIPAPFDEQMSKVMYCSSKMNKMVYKPKVMEKKDNCREVALERAAIAARRASDRPHVGAGHEVVSERAARAVRRVSEWPHVEGGGGMEPCSKKRRSTNTDPWPIFDFRSESGWGVPVSCSKLQPQPQPQLSARVPTDSPTKHVLSPQEPQQDYVENLKNSDDTNAAMQPKVPPEPQPLKQDQSKDPAMQRNSKPHPNPQPMEQADVPPLPPGVISVSKRPPQCQEHLLHPQLLFLQKVLMAQSKKFLCPMIV